MEGLNLITCLSHDKIAAKLSGLTKRFDGFTDEYGTLNSELKIAQNCNSLLLKHVYQLECNAVSNSEYHRRETLEINHLPLNIQDNVLEEIVHHVVSPTEINVSPDQLHLSLAE